MIEGVFFLQSYGYFGGSAIETLFATWQQAGFFSHLLPFLLIFALLYGILTNMKLALNSTNLKRLEEFYKLSGTC